MAFSVEYVFNSLNIRSLNRPHGRGSWGGGTEPPFYQLGGVWESAKLPSGVQGRSPADKRFSRVLSVQSGLSRQFSVVYCSL